MVSASKVLSYRPQSEKGVSSEEMFDPVIILTVN